MRSNSQSPHFILYWDRPALTNKTVDYCKPFYSLKDKKHKTAYIIVIGSPLTTSLKIKTEKVNTFLNICIQFKEMWKLQFVRIFPVIATVEELTIRTLIQSKMILELPDGLVIINNTADM